MKEQITDNILKNTFSHLEKILKEKNNECGREADKTAAQRYKPCEQGNSGVRDRGVDSDKREE